MKILITGGTGTIGSAIAERLKGLDAETIVIMSNDEDGLYHARKRFGGGVYQYVHADVRDLERMHAITEKVDLVFHCAAMKHIPACEENPAEAVKLTSWGLATLYRRASVTDAI